MLAAIPLSELFSDLSKSVIFWYISLNKEKHEFFKNSPASVFNEIKDTLVELLLIHFIKVSQTLLFFIKSLIAFGDLNKILAFMFNNFSRLSSFSLSTKSGKTLKNELILFCKGIPNDKTFEYNDKEVETIELSSYFNIGIFLSIIL